VSRAAFRKALRIYLATMAVALLAVAIVAWQFVSYPTVPLSPGETKKREFVVERGMALPEIARRLEQQGLIDHPVWFRLVASRRGVAGKIKAGRYELSPSMAPLQVLEVLVLGAKEEEVVVTIPEGKNLVEVCELLAAAGVAKRADLERAARDRALAERLGIPGATLEGYLFPDTYRFRPNTPAVKVVSTMREHQRRVFNALETRHPGGLETLRKDLGWGEFEAVTLASIVEKETGAPQERPRIAAVFLNRLRLPTFEPKLLQTDPTIVYGCTVPLVKSAACQKFEGRIRRVHLEDRDNPYSTYTHLGLPPGPISNPGRAALEAVLAPEPGAPYLYFVSRNDGTHYFSSTEAEHEAAVDRFQRAARPSVNP
jgi:UPF0755 protein